MLMLQVQFSYTNNKTLFFYGNMNDIVDLLESNNIKIAWRLHLNAPGAYL
jgi:hypothetical protein